MDAWILRPEFKRMMAPPSLRVAVLRVGADGEEIEPEDLTLARESWAEDSEREGLLEELVQCQISIGRRHLVLDLATLEKMDASGVGEIAAAFQRAAELGGGLVLANLVPKAREIFRRTGIDRKIPVFDSIPEALEHLAERSDV